MQVVLIKNVPGLGKRGDSKAVSDGYGRNFLLKNGLAQILTPGITRKLEQEKQNREKSVAFEKEKSFLAKEKIESAKLAIKSKIGDSGRAFGSVTPLKIASELARRGIKLEKDRIISEPIKTLGEHRVKIKLPHGVEAELTVVIEPENKG